MMDDFIHLIYNIIIFEIIMLFLLKKSYYANIFVWEDK